jgi:hypothetical protein
MKARNLPWIPFAFFAIVIGLYPSMYYILDMKKGFLQTKPAALQADTIWHLAFYTHITFGGLALLTGWTQFSQRLRDKYLKTHRTMGTIYLLAVLFSSTAALYIDFFASGGIVCVTGFGTLAILWLGTAIMGYRTIRRLEIDQHQDWMTINYSLAFAAVTLRIYLPILQMGLHVPFIPAYRIVAWACWVPNLVLALLIIRKRRRISVPGIDSMVLLFLCASLVTILNSAAPLNPVNSTIQHDKLIFFDDFSGPSLDRSKWNVETRIHVNDELQSYVDSAATIYLKDNALVLQPIYSPGYVGPDGHRSDFISGRINTKNKFDFKYGTAEARIRISDGVGLWPAWWILGNGPWPATGEIDIMEYIGDKSWASAAVHGPGYSGNTPFVSRHYFDKGNDITHWHTYAVDWTPDSLVFKYDGTPMYSVTKTMAAKYGTWAFDNNKYLILNFAVGGVYPAKVNGIEKPYYGLAPATLGLVKNKQAKMWVDWVRVTQH